MIKGPMWIALLCVAALIFWILTKRQQDTKIWETTPGGPYEVFVTDGSISCTHPNRATELIRWDEIKEIRLVTTSDGPFLPDEWYLFIGENGGCSVQSAAKGFADEWVLWENSLPPLSPIADNSTHIVDQLRVMLGSNHLQETPPSPTRDIAEIVRIGLEASRIATEKMLDYYRRMGIRVTPQMTLAPDEPNADDTQP